MSNTLPHRATETVLPHRATRSVLPHRATGTVTTNDGARIAVYDHGTPVDDQPTLVLVHGWAAAASSWDPVIERLGSGRTITLDLRGHGQSNRATPDATVHRLAEDVHQVLRTLDLGPIVLAGHSLGCAVIWAYLELHGSGGVAGLALIDQSPAMARDPAWSEAEAADAGAVLTAEDFYSLAAALAAPDSAVDTMRSIITDLAGPGSSAELIDQALDTALRVDPGYAATLLRNHALHDWRSRITAIDRPTLVLHGTQSIFPPSGSVWIERTVATARRIPIDGHHLLPSERPADLAEALHSFLRELSPCSDQ
ncbi:MAG: alpha/beta fold hydrolase [Pseudonocardiaceae bacterium]